MPIVTAVTTPGVIPPVDDRVLMDEIRVRTARLLRHALPLCRENRARLPDPVIRFDLRGQAAGQVRWHRRGRCEIRYNLDIARRHRADFLARTVPHEVAHLLTVTCHGRTSPHGPEWRAMMQYLGVSAPTRCHDYSVDEGTVRRQRRWRYQCRCREHQLSTTRHKRIQCGLAVYRCSICGSDLSRTSGDRN